MPTTKELLQARLPRTEGRCLKPYKDTVGKWTVGVGHNISDNGLAGRYVASLLEIGQLTDQLTADLLAEDLDKVFVDCKAIPAYRGLDPARQSVIADMVFNMGLGAVLNFVNTLSFIQKGDFQSAAAQMLKSKWAEQVGNRAVELARIMSSGEIKSPKSLV